jgi:hypothetical protein
MNNFDDVLNEILNLENENKKKAVELDEIGNLVAESKANFQQVIQDRLKLKNQNHKLVICFIYKLKFSQTIKKII